MEDQNTQLKARREFLAKCGRFAAVTPPAMAFLLSTTASSEATGLSHGQVTTSAPTPPEPEPFSMARHLRKIRFGF